MAISAKARRVPLRLSTGAYVLNSGINAFGTDDQASRRIQTTVAQYMPQVERIDPRTFSRMVGAGEVTLGAALLLPIVPTAAAGLALSAFGGSLLVSSFRTNGTHADGAEAPHDEPVKDMWLFGSGASLLLDALISPAHDKHVEVSATMHEKAAAKKRQLRRSRRRAAALGAISAAQLGEKAHVAGERLHEAGERVVELRDEYQPVAAKKLKRARKKARKAAAQASDRIQQAVS